MNGDYPVYSIQAGSWIAPMIVFGALALLSLAYCVRVARAEGKVWPLGVFGGSMLLNSYEPFNNFLAHCAYPTGGEHHDMLTFLGQHVPWSTWFIYMFYFSVAVPYLMRRFEAGVTLRQFGQFYAVAVLICGAFEPLFANVHLGVRWWYYYGDNQALNFTGLPVFWWFANAMVVMATAVIFHVLRRHLLTSDRQTWLFVPLEPLILFGVHGSAGIPVFAAITGGASEAVVTVATFGSLAICGLYLWIMAKAVTVPAAATVPAAGGPAGDPHVAVPTAPARVAAHA